VPIFEVGEHLGQHYFSMKLVDGGACQSSWLAGGDPRSSAALMAVVRWAVHYAHQARILHLDLKPANILLRGRGEPPSPTSGPGGPRWRGPEPPGVVRGPLATWAPELARAGGEAATGPTLTPGATFMNLAGGRRSGPRSH
jgi:serine/threonine protein kinase